MSAAIILISGLPLIGMLVAAGWHFFVLQITDGEHLRGAHPGCKCVLCQGHRGEL